MTGKVLLSCAVAAALLGGACSGGRAASRVPLRIAGGPPDATFDILATALAAAYNSHLANVNAASVETGGTTANIEEVETGAADCGLVSADLVYNAFVRGTTQMPRPHERLRGVAVLFPNTLHVVTRADSEVTSLSGLSGRTMAAALPGEIVPGRLEPRMDAISGTITELASAHVAPRVVMLGMDEGVQALETSTIDAADFYGGIPFRPVTEAAGRYGIRILEFDDNATALLKSKYPFFKPVVVPANTYAGQVTDIRTVAVDNLLVCRADLPGELVYQLTRTLYDSLPSIVAAHASAGQINPETGASTPIPLHEGASRYFRERELFR